MYRRNHPLRNSSQNGLPTLAWAKKSSPHTLYLQYWYTPYAPKARFRNLPPNHDLEQQFLTEMVGFVRKHEHKVSSNHALQIHKVAFAKATKLASRRQRSRDAPRTAPHKRRQHLWLTA